MHLPKFKILLSYLTIYIVWGSTYLAMRWAVESLAPFYLVGIRFFIGGSAFLVLSIVAGKLRRKPTLLELGSSLLMGIFLLLLGNGLMSVGLQRIDSYLAAIIISATPFCVALFNRILFRQKIASIRLIGIIIGFLGVVSILYNEKNPFASLDPYVLFVIAGLFSWAFATSLGHKIPVYPNNLVNSGLQMIFAGMLALALSQFLYSPLPELIPNISVRSWWAVAYLATIGSAAYYAYVYLLAHEPSIRVVSYAIVNPLIAVILGLILGNEKAVPLLALGMPFIFIGLVFMLYGESIRNSLIKKTAKEKGQVDDDVFDKSVKD
jgi:drug/metabolite transporter (DMT)-like permease